MTILHVKRILIVEDDALNRLVFRLLLNHAGAVLEFDGGGNFQAFAYRRTPVDLILLDLTLPLGQCGYTWFQAMQALPVFRRTPIVAVSATDPDIARARTRTLGFHGFIPKPIDADRFPRDLAHVLRGNTLWSADTDRPLDEAGNSFSLQTGPLHRIKHGTGPLFRNPRV
jgi:two-component system cell cycle response regulator DivK